MYHCLIDCDEECDDSEADGSGCAIPLPPDLISSQGVRTFCADLSLCPKFGLVTSDADCCRASALLSPTANAIEKWAMS